ncbi:hypothetical protein SAMN05216490_0644 [Mucilaginibacter mallensis]|uniref:Uncharacterized protein n=1 Tax=Mucilaginibacter mallensis TaxID=652787 RepID=A0A1H1PXI9_MUCMA|nr:hypothetical protein [Mucilaginibacter mallensis]SDS15898.1 hypothetical protein SAMN05216490_0644 [Mucilaginibacter mallensis]
MDQQPEPLPDLSTDNPSSQGWKVTYQHYGRLAAKNMNANAGNLDSSLDNIYERFLSEQRLDGEGLKQRIKMLREELLQKKNQKEGLSSTLITVGQQKEAVDNKIEQLEIEKVNLKDTEAPAIDYLPFVIGIFITLLLTCYLFVFYSSSGYSAFYGVKQGSLGFINSNVFADAKTKGGGVIALIVLFPVIFLGMGFLIHDALSKRKYLFIAALLVFTFIADGIIGYKIAQGVHDNAFNAGLAKDQWDFHMVFSDINFYLVLALGFVVYIIWGALLHYVLHKNHEMQPDKALEIRLDNMDRKIADQRQVLLEHQTRINELKGQLAIIENELSEKEKDIIGYENGVIPVNPSLLKSYIGEFMMGWYAYTNLMYPADANKRTLEAKDKQKEWLEKKLESLSKEH